jgi:single-strand DNA-binding protein
MNVVLLRGVLSRPSERRSLPSGSTVVAYEVTTRGAEGTLTVPVVWVDAPPAGELAVGEEVVVAGSVRRRFFRTGAGTGSRTEVLATQVVPVRQRKRAEAVVRRVGEHVLAS